MYFIHGQRTHDCCHCQLHSYDAEDLAKEALSDCSLTCGDRGTVRKIICVCLEGHVLWVVMVVIWVATDATGC